MSVATQASQGAKTGAKVGAKKALGVKKAPALKRPKILLPADLTLTKIKRMEDAVLWARNRAWEDYTTDTSSTAYSQHGDALADLSWRLRGTRHLYAKVAKKGASK